MCTSFDMVVLPLTVFPKKIIGEVIKGLIYMNVFHSAL